MTTGASPYVVPFAADTDPSSTVLETTLTADEALVDIGLGVTANAETFNGAIPGPTLRLKVGDTVIVRLVNRLAGVTGIHWHGIELHSSADGTPFTQDQVAPAGSPPLAGRATFLYKFIVPRPGLYWYHPHHHGSSNQVFRGLYGMIIVEDPHEAALIAAGVLPAAADTMPLVISDTTVCKAVGMNDAATYSPTLPWVGGVALPVQPGPTPIQLCETQPLDEHGGPGTAFGASDIPNIQRMDAGRTNEGQTVLTNGMNVGGRAGSPNAPGALAVGAFTHPVLAGQGLRLQVANTCAVRYLRLILTEENGDQVQLFRVGGEGGLLDNPVLEGGVIGGPGGFDTKYGLGEILLPPASRADVVAAIPSDATGVLTLWTQDFSRTGQGFTNTATVPVMHLSVTGMALTPYAIGVATQLRAGILGAAVPTLGPASATLLDPALFAPGKPGMSAQNIQITLAGGMIGFDSTVGTHDVVGPYTSAAHLDSSRYAAVGVGDILQLSVENTTNAHHPFHLHGFSFQPISLTRTGFPTYTWPYREFRDNVDIPAGYTLTFRLRIDERMLADGVTPGGAFGRWMFHCHIFFHAHLGMVSELVSTAANGREKPNVNVIGSWAYAPSGGTTTRQGTFSSPDGTAVSLSTTLGSVTPTGANTWSWTHAPIPDDTHYVYVTAQDADGRRDQTVFRLKVGGMDDGSDTGDPHIRTVDGTYYDFQAVGEFILLRDTEGFEVQVRQTPVPAANPILDGYSGLTTCVSINTAVAARVGNHRIAYQQTLGERGRLQLYVDGKAADVPQRGFNFNDHRITMADSGELRVDYAGGAVLTITPWFWNSHNVWLLNVTIARTAADEGLMGRIAPNNWLPTLPNGRDLGPRPASLPDRYVALYHTFADAWRVTGATSLFVYAPGTSTDTFTDRAWPAERPPCALQPQFAIPGANPPQTGFSRAVAERMCRLVTVDDLHRSCVFDVATTGDGSLVNMYLEEQQRRLRRCGILLVSDKARSKHGETVTFTAAVSALTGGQGTPRGRVIFLVDGDALGASVPLDASGGARLTTAALAPGLHQVHAEYVPEARLGCNPLMWIWLLFERLGARIAAVETERFDPCSSANVAHTVE